MMRSDRRRGKRITASWRSRSSTIRGLLTVQNTLRRDVHVGLEEDQSCRFCGGGDLCICCTTIMLWRERDLNLPSGLPYNGVD